MKKIVFYQMHPNFNSVQTLLPINNFSSTVKFPIMWLDAPVSMILLNLQISVGFKQEG